MTPDPRAAWNAVERLAAGDRGSRQLARALADVLREPRVSEALATLAEDAGVTGGLLSAEQAAEEAFGANARPGHVESRGRWEEAIRHLPAPEGVTHQIIWRRNLAQNRTEAWETRSGEASLDTGRWRSRRLDPAPAMPDGLTWTAVPATDRE